MGRRLSTVKDLSKRYPGIPWDEPVIVYVQGEPFWVCRICIATFGLKGAHIRTTPFAYKIRDEAREHIKEHP